jgi:long-chain acyl-CoA synthetase
MIPSLPKSIADLPFFAAGRFPKPAMIGRCRDGQIETMSAREFADQVRDVALGLQTLGIGRNEPVALLAESRPEWLLADFATLACGAITVPIYPTLSAEQVTFILKDSGARVTFVSTPLQLQKLVWAAGQGVELQTVIALDVLDDAARCPFPVITLAEVAARGHRQILDGWGIARNFRDAVQAIAPDDLATIIYTSGTTGEPKGVMLSHANLVANLDGIGQVIPLGPDDIALSFLPLCHAFERIVAYIYFTTGVTMIFAESIDTVPGDLRRVRPTVMTGVPRVFEKLHARVVATGHEQGGVKRRLFDWALRVAERRGRALENGGTPSASLAFQARAADRLVFQKVRAGVGGRLRYAVSGSAPLRVDLGRTFLGMGLPILEGYGLTETAPVLTVMPLTRIKFGTVGPSLPNVELRVAEDGEIVARGPNVTCGYFNRPDETRAVFRDGWFHTGDIGVLDADGYLTITDRKKELLVTSGGKKIAPQPVEAALCAAAIVAEAILVGDRRHFPAALIIPDFRALARQIGAEMPAAGPEAERLLARPDVNALFAAVVDAVNARLAQFERIKKFTLLAAELTVATGELTPTLKVKRRVIEERFRRQIEAMYR